MIGEIPEPSLDLIDPRGPGRSEMDIEPWMFVQPVSDGDGFVGREVVADDVHVEFGRDRFVDRDQKLLEFDGSMTAMRCGNDSAVGDVERCEQTGDAGTDVIVTAPLRHAGHHRQYRLGPIQCLHAGFLVHTQHHRMFGRIVIQANDIDDLVDELRIGAEEFAGSSAEHRPYRARAR